MNDNVFDSIADIDAKLDEEFGKVANEPETSEPSFTEIEAQDDVNSADDTSVSDNETTEADNSSEENTSENKIEEKGTFTNDKDYHAFADLRAKNSELKKEKESLENNNNFLKDIAASYGYDSVENFQKAYNEAKIRREAKEKGYDEELYRQTIEQRERIEALEKEREHDKLNAKLNNLKFAIDAVASDYKVDQKEIFDRLNNSGIDADDLINIQNPRVVLDGLFIDKIRESAKQNQINDMQNMKDLVEDKNENGANPSSITIDALLKEDLAKYKADNFYD